MRKDSSSFTWFVLIWFGFWGALFLASIGLTVYGLYLAWAVSFWMFVLAFLVEPAPLIIALIWIFADKNIAQMFWDLLTK